MSAAIPILSARVHRHATLAKGLRRVSVLLFGILAGSAATHNPPANSTGQLARTVENAKCGVMTKKSLKGQLLISAGGLYDPNFRHTVVLIGEHGPEGAVGVTLTRPLDVTVEEVIPTLADLVEPGERLFQGGPVEPSQAVLLADVADPDLLDVPVFGTVGFLTGEVPSDVRPDVRRARVFVGHAGWSPGQLEAELEADSWILEEATKDDVFTISPEALWRRVLERKGPPYTTLARLPFDPRTN